MLILANADVEAVLPMKECIALMAEATAALARGQAHQPLRTVFRSPGSPGLLGLMPGHIITPDDHSYYGLKAITVFPGNSNIGKEAHQGAVIIFSGQTGEPMAMINAAAITAIRTAAVSGLATRLLAREAAADLAIVGAGVQARAHLEAMACVRPIARVRVASRKAERARRFVDDVRPLFEFPIQAVETVEEAVCAAELIVTVTNAAEPVLRREWISAGAHINAVGAVGPTVREVDAATVAAARLFVDRRESALNESGDYLLAAREGAIGPEHIVAELGELVIGAKAARTSESEITLFKSLGLAVEDLAAGVYAFQRALQIGLGASVIL